MDVLSINPSNSGVFKKDPTPLVLRIFFVGIGFYLFSFFLPAVRRGPHDTAAGWQFAFIGPIAWSLILQGVTDARIVAAACGGLVNFIAVAYAVLRILDNATRVRLALAASTLACIPLTWFSLKVIAENPLVGYAVWIAGLLLMVIGDIWDSLRRIRRRQRA